VGVPEETRVGTEVSEGKGVRDGNGVRVGGNVGRIGVEVGRFAVGSGVLVGKAAIVAAAIVCTAACGSVICGAEAWPRPGRQAERKKISPKRENRFTRFLQKSGKTPPVLVEVFPPVL